MTGDPSDADGAAPPGDAGYARQIPAVSWMTRPAPLDLPTDGGDTAVIPRVEDELPRYEDQRQPTAFDVEPRPA
ncbi:MAG TPA: hypothetical protein VFU35_11865, partial [Jatrophihabitans sp.]|nr:hypothetical protein [Jatrophihabitans sp.]